MNIKWGFFALLTCSLFCFLPEAVGKAAELTVMRPPKYAIPRDIKKIFIDPDMIEDTNDRLKLKFEVVVALKRRLNDLGRFETIIGPPRGFDPNRETVAIVQGDVISGGRIDHGQLTEKAVCRGGLSGIAGAATAAETSEQGITFSRRGMLCKKANLQSSLMERGITAGLGMLGVQEFPRQDEVIRIYKYKNSSLFAQVNLSLTQVGTEREMLVIRSDAASFSRHAVEPGSYRNVRESGDNAPLIWLWFRVTPIAPVVIREIGVVRATNPGSSLARWYEYITPDVKDIDPDEREEIITRLVNKTLDQFVRTISPYRTVIETELASGGNQRAKEKIRDGEYAEARRLLRGAKTAPDLYHLGLAYEAGATTTADFEDARLYYDQALDKDPTNRLYARGIGRMEFQLKSHQRNEKP